MKAIPSKSVNVAAATAQAERETDSADVLPRQSLRSALDLSAWLDCRRAAEIALGVAAALCDAQRRNAQPLGLQPENIFISDDGQVFVNAANHRSAAAPRIAAQYLSPEAVRSEPTDARSDLYALGIVLYEMLTDRVPFDGSDAEVIKQKHLHRTPEPPKIFRADVPDALSQLVMRLLEKDPAKRPQRAADLVNQLQQVIDDEVTAANRQELNEATISDIFRFADYAPAEFSHERALSLDDAVLDLEFNDLFLSGAAQFDDATLSESPDESYAAQSPASPAALTSAEDPAWSSDIAYALDGGRTHGALMTDTEVDPAASREPFAATARHRPASTVASLERDPFDLPTVTAIEPRASLAVASALPAQTELAAKTKKEKALVAEPGDARLRWLALLLMCMVVGAALLLYNVVRPAATKTNDLVAPAHLSSPPVQPAVPSPGRSPNDLADTTGGESGLRVAPNTLPSPRRSATRSTRGKGAKAAVAVAKRRANSSNKARPGKHRKRGWARRVMIGK
ncbi:MAG: eukaryotic-like serine/threonine-protein kinase [Blastocatellia bacterium]